MVVGIAAAMSRHGSGPALAMKQAYASVMGMVQAQATALAFVNAFWVVAVIVTCLVPLPFLLKKPEGSANLLIGH